MDLTTFCLRLLTALLAGSAIGIERQWHHKRAGLRTNTLVALGAAIYVLLSLQLIEGNGDITRVIGQVIVGVGFLGAGVILHQGMEIQGLTTAATIWCSAAIGCLAGAGFYMECIISTATILSVNAIFQRIDDFIKTKRS